MEETTIDEEGSAAAAMMKSEPFSVNWGFGEIIETREEERLQDEVCFFDFDSNSCDI